MTKRGIVKNLVLALFAVVLVLGLNKTQTFAKHDYHYGNTTTETTASVTWDKEPYGTENKVTTFKIYWNEGPYTNWDNYNFCATGANTISFSKLKPGTVYSINVQCDYVDSEGNTHENMNVTHGKFVTKPGKIANVKITPATKGKSMTVTWDGQAAVDYEYMVTDLKGKAIKGLSGKVEETYKITPNKVKISGVNTKTTSYLVKVRGYFTSDGKKYVGPWSNVAASLAPVNVKKATFSNKKITVKWAGVTGATEYLVAVSTNAKTGFKLKARTNSKTLSYSFSKLNGKKVSSSKKYYVYVVAKVKLNGKTVKTPKGTPVLVKVIEK